MMRALLLVLVLCQACAVADLTEVVVSIETEARLRMRSQSLSLRVSTVAGSTVLENSNAPWTDGRYTLALAPQADANSRYVVEVRALEGGVAIAQARLISGFVQGQTRYVRLRLEDVCVGMLRCEGATTCRAGSCVDAEVEPSELGASSDDAPISTAREPATEQDAAPAGDAAPVATGDASAQDASSALPSIPPKDAGTPRDASEPSASARCGAGFYEGTWSGEHTYAFLWNPTTTQIVASSTVAAPVVSLVVDDNGASSTHAVRGCVSASMKANASVRPWLARLQGTVDCTTGELEGTLVGHYVVADTAFPFQGTYDAQLFGAQLVDGSWDIEEPSDPEDGKSGTGFGEWSASFRAPSGPTILEPCATL